MKLWKKILLSLLAIILLVQIPFIYNRFQTAGLAEKITKLQSERTNFSNPKFKEYKGAVHVHSFIGGHSTGNFDELIKGANTSGLDFVIMTEHTSTLYDTSAMTLQGVYQNVLFVGGSEANTSEEDRFLIPQGSADSSKMIPEGTVKSLEKIHAENKIALITYPEKYKSWEADFDGIEVFSLHTNAKEMNAATFLPDALWAYYSYPELTLARYFKRPVENLQKFDEISQSRKITLFAGSDAHSNIGYFLGDDASNKLFYIKLDRYEMIFRLVRTHILLEKETPLTPETLLEAFRKGHTFIGFDVFGDTGGFTFSAENGQESCMMGDEITLTENLRLKASAPNKVRFVLFKNGLKIFESKELTEINFQPKEKGVYRVEVYLDSLGEELKKMPWIISNPIYVR